MNIRDYLEEYFRKGGINKQDKILLHSDISYLWKNLKKLDFSLSVKDILNSLINYLGEKTSYSNF